MLSFLVEKYSDVKTLAEGKKILWVHFTLLTHVVKISWFKDGSKIKGETRARIDGSMETYLGHGNVPNGV